MIRRLAGNYRQFAARARPADRQGRPQQLGNEAQEGTAVIKRFAVVAAAALSCAGCANQVLQPMGLGYYGQLDQGPAAAASAITGERTAASKSSNFAGIAPGANNMKQTLGGKVLSAMALERVTGRKPDPRRFNELH